MKTLQKKFHDHLATDFPELYAQKSLLAISGGIDSTVLTHLCNGENLNFELAHCNFKLRGNESEEDEKFVKELGRKLDLKVHVKAFNTLQYAEKNSKSTQIAARELRYAWFEKLCKEESLDYILTAHHLNDDIETFFINTLRGTGLKGLTGIPAQHGNIGRPLLKFTRPQISAFAKQNDINWREDCTNATEDYLRNRIRHHIVPFFEREANNFSSNFGATREHLAQAFDLLEDYSEILRREIVQKQGETYYLNVQRIKAKPHPQGVLYRLLHKFGFSAWEDIYELLEAQPGKQVFSENYRLIRDREYLILGTRNQKEQKKILVHKNDKEVRFPVGRIICQNVINVTDREKNLAYLAPEKLNFPMELRPWRPGDRFRPFGMKGHKKISDFLKDEKVSRPEKENTWVLCSEGQIVWVVGHRIHHAFRVQKNTKNILKLELVK